MKQSLGHMTGKYAAVAPLWVISPNTIEGIAEELIIYRRDGSIVTVPTVFHSANDLEELRSDLKADIDRIIDVAIEVLR